MREDRVRTNAFIKRDIYDAARVMAKAEHKPYKAFISELTERAIESKINLLATIRPLRPTLNSATRIAKPVNYNTGGSLYVR